MRTSRWVLVAVLCLSGGLLSTQVAGAGGPAFISGGAVESIAEDASPAGPAALREIVNISDLFVTEGGDEVPVVSLRRGNHYIFWLKFDPPICSPYMNRIVAFKGAKQVFERVWMNEEPYCDIGGVGISVTIAADAALGKYRWGGQTITFYDSDTAFPAAYQVIDVVP